MSRNRRNKQTSHNSKPQTQEIQQTSVQSIEYNGPIPPAQELDRFEQVLPGAAERIVTMAEKSQNHMHHMNSRSLEATASEVKRGQVFGLIVTLTAFIATGVIAYLGHPTVAGILGGTTIVAIATAFILGRKK